MPNVNDLQIFLKADNCETGDTVKFLDAGKIFEKDFKQKDGSSKNKVTFEMTVLLNGEKKKTYAPNATTIKLLKDAWGEDSENWVGHKGEVTIVEQLSFGELKPILIVKPITDRKPQHPPAKPKQAGDVNMATDHDAVGGSENNAHAEQAADWEEVSDPTK